MHVQKRENANFVLPSLRGLSVPPILSLSLIRVRYCKVISASTVNSFIFETYLSELCVFLRDHLKMENAFSTVDNACIHKKEMIWRIKSQFWFVKKFISPHLHASPYREWFLKDKKWCEATFKSCELSNLSCVFLERAQKIIAVDCNGYFRHISRTSPMCCTVVIKS